MANVGIDLYRELPHAKKMKFTSSEPFTPIFVQSHLSKSLKGAEIYASRIKSKQIFLDNPQRESRAARERKERHAKAKKEGTRKRLGLIDPKEARERGIWKLDERQIKYDLFLPLHHLWVGYMSELLGLSPPPLLRTQLEEPPRPTMPNAAGMHAKLVKADFHGSIVTVRQSKNPCLVGIGGIVIHETENAFKVVTANDQLKLIPKQNSIFAFAVPLYDTSPPQLGASQAATAVAPHVPKIVTDGPHIEFELHGNQFRFRSAERAGKKFKHKESIEL